MRILNFGLMIKDPAFWLLVFIVLFVLIDDFIKKIIHIKKFKQNLIQICEKLKGRYYDENTNLDEINIESEESELIKKIPRGKNKILSSIGIFNVSNQTSIISLIIHNDSNIKGVHTRIATKINNENIYLRLVAKNLRTILNNEKKQKTGIKEIDKRFYLDTNNIETTKKLFSNNDIYNLLMQNKELVINIQEGNFVIDVKGVIKNSKKLIQLILFSNLIVSKLNVGESNGF